MTPKAKTRRRYWIAELEKLSRRFGDDFTRLHQELRDEIAREGASALLDHLRICGAMPERYGRDSSAEKLYSKYTDAVICAALNAIGLKSVVIDSRADVADVAAQAANFSLVADAKAFRLSRTAKNQKDFKVQAMDGWRGTSDFALVVCPIYQLPGTSSQIYQQAIARNVCVLSYSHLAALVSLAVKKSPKSAESGLRRILQAVATFHLSKSAADYWIGINRRMVAALRDQAAIWTDEKQASLDCLAQLKIESVEYLRSERTRLLTLSHADALQELMRATGVDARILQVEAVAHGDLLEK